MPSSRREKAQPARTKLAKISEEMKSWSGALAEDTTRWPRVSTRIMFGFTALYRDKKIFAILPRTRGMGTPNSLAFKLESPAAQVRASLQSDRRIGTSLMRASRWTTFELAKDSDIHDALDWLRRAYAAAGKKSSGR
jgi:hypothetical protein